MSEIRIVRDYPHPPAKVWRALTDQALIPLWTATGAGGRAEGLLGHVRRKMLRVGLPAVLDDLNDDGTLRPTSTLTPKPLH